MEATDPFAAGSEAPDADPFADSGMEPDMSDPAAEIEAEPPVVDKEGQPVTQTPEEAGPTPDQPPGFPGGGAPQGDALPASDPASPAAPSTDAPEGGPTPEPAAPVAAPQQPGEEPTAPETQQPASEPPAPAEQPPAPDTGQEPPAPAQTAGDGSAPPPAADAPSPASPAGQGQGTPPNQGTGSQGKGQGAGKGKKGGGARGGTPQLRWYKLLYATGPKTWTEHDLKFDSGKEPGGVTIKTDDQGERWMECRNNEHALKVAFAILGNPADGVTIFPCPAGAYKPKRVKPKPPAPERTRLDIS